MKRKTEIAAVLSGESQWCIATGKAEDVLPTLPDCCIDAVVTDPPAGIGFMNRAWDHDKGGRDTWIDWMAGVAAECLRVLKPGGHALVWALPRTSHWTATAWEDAGFEVRDRISHLFGSGFPKSIVVGMAIDKAAGMKRGVGYPRLEPNGRNRSVDPSGQVPSRSRILGCDNRPRCARNRITAPATDAAKQWQGWGTALKPACEDWWLLRKPLAEPNVAANVLKHGTGAINVDAARVGMEVGDIGDRVDKPGKCSQRPQNHMNDDGSFAKPRNYQEPAGRWPANITHDGSDEVLAGFPETESGAGIKTVAGSNGGGRNAFNDYRRPVGGDAFVSDSGSAARFFYCAKASRADREEGCGEMAKQPAGSLKSGDGGWAQEEERGRKPRHEDQLRARNHHPTVKATALMRYLVRLITPPGGIVLDCFAGSGSTGKAAKMEGFRFIGIEAEAQYAEIARRRIAAAQAPLVFPQTPLNEYTGISPRLRPVTTPPVARQNPARYPRN